MVGALVGRVTKAAPILTDKTPSATILVTPGIIRTKPLIMPKKIPVMSDGCAVLEQRDSEISTCSIGEGNNLDFDSELTSHRYKPQLISRKIIQYIYFEARH